MLAVLLFSLLVCSSEANEKDVVDSWTRLRISREPLGEFDFQDVRISLYNDSGNSRLTDPSTHKFYFSPMVRLDHHSAKSIFNNYTKEAQMQFNIEMWNEELRNKSFYHLREEENLSQVKLSKIGVLPLERVILTSASPLVGGYVLPRTWTPYRSTKALKFYFTCDSIQSCDELAHAMKSSPGQFTDLTVKFSLESESAKTRETIIRVSYVREGELFSKLDQRFPQADSALVTADDRKKILSETSQRILVETFDNDEIFGSVAQQNIMNILENLIFSDRQVLQQQSSDVWESVFWEKDNHRPDKAVNTVNELYSNSAKDTQDKLRQFFSSSGSNSEDIKRLISSSQSSNSRDSESNYLSKDTSSSSQQGGQRGFGFRSFSASGGYSQAAEDRAAQATSNSSAKERENTNSKHVETTDTRSNEFRLSTESDKDELLKLLEESRQNIQWSGERFVPKPLELSRINLAKIRSGQDFTDRATSLRYWTAILSTPVHVDEIHTSSFLNQAREELEQLKRTTLEQIAAIRQEQRHQVADIRQEQKQQSSIQEGLIAAVRQEQKQQVADIQQQQTQTENKLVAISNQLQEMNQKVTQLNSGLETLRKEALEPVEKKLSRMEEEFKDFPPILDIMATSPAEKERQLLAAAENGRVASIHFLLRAGTNVNCRDIAHRTPLHRAALYGHVAAVKLLLDHKADVNATDDVKQTPLHVAAAGRHADVIKVLLEHKADANAKNDFLNTPLHHAIRKGHLDAVKVLSPKTTIDSQNNHGSTPLHLAAYYGHTEIVKFLLEAGANPLIRNKDSKTPKDYAREKNHSDTYAVL